VTENSRRAKFYALTPLGRAKLRKEAASWARLSGAITSVLRIEEA